MEIRIFPPITYPIALHSILSLPSSRGGVRILPFISCSIFDPRDPRDPRFNAREGNGPNEQDKTELSFPHGQVIPVTYQHRNQHQCELTHARLLTGNILPLWARLATYEQRWPNYCARTEPSKLHQPKTHFSLFFFLFSFFSSFLPLPPFFLPCGHSTPNGTGISVSPHAAAAQTAPPRLCLGSYSFDSDSE